MPVLTSHCLALAAWQSRVARGGHTLRADRDWSTTRLSLSAFTAHIADLPSTLRFARQRTLKTTLARADARQDHDQSATMHAQIAVQSQNRLN